MYRSAAERKSQVTEGVDYAKADLKAVVENRFHELGAKQFDISGFHGFLDTHEILNSQACSFP